MKEKNFEISNSFKIINKEMPKLDRMVAELTRDFDKLKKDIAKLEGKLRRAK